LSTPLARTTSLWVLGLSEPGVGSLYISQWLIGPDGETIVKRRKLQPTHV
jgi:nitrilase